MINRFHCMKRGICVTRHALGNENSAGLASCWVSRLLDGRGQFGKNNGQCQRILAGLWLEVLD